MFAQHPYLVSAWRDTLDACGQCILMNVLCAVMGVGSAVWQGVLGVLGKRQLLVPLSPACKREGMEMQYKAIMKNCSLQRHM